MTGRPETPIRFGADRSSWPFRSTASGLLIRAGLGLLEKRSDQAAVTPGVFDTPGGHLLPGELPEAALVRELEEELAVVPTSFRLLRVYDADEGQEKARYRHFVYLVERWMNDPRPREDQVLAWIPLAEIPTHPRVNPAIASIVAAMNSMDFT